MKNQKNRAATLQLCNFATRFSVKHLVLEPYLQTDDEHGAR